MHIARVLIVDGHEILRDGLKVVLGRPPNIQLVAETSDGLSTFDEAKSAAPSHDDRGPVRRQVFAHPETGECEHQSPGHGTDGQRCRGLHQRGPHPARCEDRAGFFGDGRDRASDRIFPPRPGPETDAAPPRALTRAGFSRLG